MSTSLDELFPEEQEALAAPKPRSTVAKAVFTVILLVVGTILAGVVGSAGVGIVSNAFGVGLDARHCNLQHALQCNSVSIPEINEATGVKLPSDAMVAESRWWKTPKSGSLSALVESPEPGWAPPASVYEACGTTRPCTDETPDAFERNGIDVQTEFVRRLDLGDGSQWHVFVGRDDDGQEWVSIEYFLNL